MHSGLPNSDMHVFSQELLQRHCAAAGNLQTVSQCAMSNSVILQTATDTTAVTSVLQLVMSA